jgi:excinuclease ABC subunit C
VLEDIPGVGEGRKKALLRAFGSLKRIREASIEELAAEAGLGTTLAERIHAHLHAPESELRREVAEGQVTGTPSGKPRWRMPQRSRAPARHGLKS